MIDREDSPLISRDAVAGGVMAVAVQLNLTVLVILGLLLAGFAESRTSALIALAILAPLAVIASLLARRLMPARPR